MLNLLRIIAGMQRSLMLEPCVTLDGAPVATDATGATYSGFTANWEALEGAGAYYIELSALPYFGGAALVAEWTFPTSPSDYKPSDTGIPGNTDKVLTTTATGTLSLGTGVDGGTDLAASATGWDNGSGTKYWQVELNTSDAFGLTLSSAQKGAPTGPKNFKVQYRIGTDGTWTDVPGGDIVVTTAFGVTNLSLPSACDDQPQVFLRWIMTSNARVATTGTVASSGVAYIDDISISAASTTASIEGYSAIGAGSGTSFALDSLISFKDYYYRVRGASHAGCQLSDASNVIHVQTLVAPVYYSQGDGAVADPIWSYATLGPAGYAPWSDGGQDMVVQAGHTVTNTSVNSVNNLQVETGGTLVLGSTYLIVHGDLASFDGTLIANDGSFLIFSGSSSALLESAGGPLSLWNLIINTPDTISTDATIDIRGTLTVQAGDLDASSGNVTLTSTASGTGRLDIMELGTSYTGNLTVQRYIPAGQTNWRMLGSVISGRTIADWIGQFATFGFTGSDAPGTDIPSGVLPAGASIRYFDEAASGGDLATGMLSVAITTDLDPGKGYYVWLDAATDAITIELTGEPNIGQTPITLPMSYTDTGHAYDGSNFGSCDGMNLVCNPLPSPIKFTSITRGADVANEYWIFDPITSTFLHWNAGVSDGSANGIIQSGQAFWVVATGSDLSTTVDEGAKSPLSTGGTFG